MRSVIDGLEPSMTFHQKGDAYCCIFCEIQNSLFHNKLGVVNILEKKYKVGNVI